MVNAPAGIPNSYGTPASAPGALSRPVVITCLATPAVFDGTIAVVHENVLGGDTDGCGWRLGIIGPRGLCWREMRGTLGRVVR